MMNCGMAEPLKPTFWRKKMSKLLYAGIDVSKNKLDVAIASERDKLLANATFENCLSDINGFKQMKKWIKKRSKQFENVHFCIESTNNYHEEIAEFLQEEGFIVSVINPFQSKSFACSKLSRTKNDRVDAAILANYCLIYQPEETVKSPEEIKTLKNYRRNLSKLIATRAEFKTKLQNCKNSNVAHVLDGTIVSLSGSIAQMENLLKEHIEKNPELKEKMALLKTVPGIGDKTAYAILSEIHTEDGKNLNVKAQVAHAGLAPREYQSGSSINGKTRICKTGNAELRKALYLPAMCCIVNNPVLCVFYNRLLDRGKPKMVALVAVMRKLLAICIGVLRNNQPFQVDWAKRKKEEFVLTH
jgi:transposase